MNYIECKNKNEYRLDEKLYIKDIRHCQCRKKSGNKYDLDCKIVERGHYSYSYLPNEAFISRNNKKLWLGEKAMEKISIAIKVFEDTLLEAKKTYVKAVVPECSLTIFYRRNMKHHYDFITLRETAGESQIKLTIDREIEWMIKDITFDLNLQERDESKRKTIENLFESKADTIKNNPLYISAVENNDELLQKQLRLYYHIASDEDCSWLAKFLGLRVLPSLPKEYNKEYVVDSGTVDLVILDRSGYTIRHRPYFAMINRTHAKCLLNPHTKMGVDAACIDAESISFSEYLDLFENKEQNGK